MIEAGVSGRFLCPAHHLDHPTIYSNAPEEVSSRLIDPARGTFQAMCRCPYKGLLELVMANRGWWWDRFPNGVGGLLHRTSLTLSVGGLASPTIRPFGCFSRNVASFEP